jgi:hypothetical protein
MQVNPFNLESYKLFLLLQAAGRLQPAAGLVGASMAVAAVHCRLLTCSFPPSRGFAQLPVLN